MVVKFSPVFISVIRCTARNNHSSSKYNISRRFSTLPSKMADHSYKLKYFNFRVLGEPIRWQFALAGIPFDDERLARDHTWDEKFKSVTGWGRLPILEIDGKIQISQSCAISRYLAKEFGLLPETTLQKAQADELVDNLQDLRLLWRPWVRESDVDKKVVLEKEMLDTHFPFYLHKVENFMRQNGVEGFVVGGKLSWADLFLANFMQIWTENHGEYLLDDYPLLKAHMHKIINIPNIKAWIESRPQTKI